MVIIVDKLPETLSKLKKDHHGDGKKKGNGSRRGRRRSSINKSFRITSTASHCDAEDTSVSTELMNRSVDYCFTRIHNDYDDDSGHDTKSRRQLGAASISAQTTLPDPAMSPLKKCRRILRRLSWTLTGELLVGPDDDDGDDNKNRNLNLPNLQHRRRASLVRVQKAIAQLTNEEEVLQNSIRLHQARAIARYNCKNETGAVLSMRRVAKLEDDFVKLSNGVGYLRTLELDLTSDIAQQYEWDERSREMGLDPEPPSEKEYVGIVQYERFDQELDQILDRNHDDGREESGQTDSVSYYSTARTVRSDEQLLDLLFKLISLEKDDSISVDVEFLKDEEQRRRQSRAPEGLSMESRSCNSSLSSISMLEDLFEDDHSDPLFDTSFALKEDG